MYYPPPEQNPKCQCWPNMMAAFWCMTGHMTECHYPYSCTEAECSHWAAQQFADMDLARFHDDPYDADQETTP